MSIKERKEREKREMQELILSTATEIITEEGLDNLSIRKIANKIDYSPAIIYHYFKDKDDIINHAMRKGYEQIINGLSNVAETSDDPRERLKQMTRKVIEMAMQIPDQYKMVQLSTMPGVLAHTASLFRGAAKEKQALGILYNCLNEIYPNMDDEQLELTAQIIWTSTFGLIIKLIIERGIPEEQRNNLIEHHIRCIIDGMILGKSITK